MQYNCYKFKFYLNATHSIYIDGVPGEEHPHTWEITLTTVKVKENFIIFNDIEKVVENYLLPFQNRYLNKMPEFAAMNPTLENISRYFKDALQTLLHENGWVLLTIEVSETPTRSYIIDISDEAALPVAAEGRTVHVDIEKTVQKKIDSMTHQEKA